MLGFKRTKTRNLGQKSAQSIYYAFEHAERIGLPLNLHVTINFAATSCASENVPAAFAALRRIHLKRWLARQRPKLAHTAVWVFENVRDKVAIHDLEPGGAHNLHAHWVVHMPAQLRHDFEQHVFAWVEKVTGGIVDPAAVVKFTDPPASAMRPYVLKGCTEQWAKIYGATAEDQGLVVGGLRGNTSANLRRSKRVALDRKLGIRRQIPSRAFHRPHAA